MKRHYSKVIVIMLFLLISVFSMSMTSAITGKVGNARAIINAEQGETIERSIKVINDNNISVLIEIFSGGDLMDDITILDSNFTLTPGEEKNARYKVYVSQAGTTESSVNVQFTGIGEKRGVGMSSTLIIKAKGNGILDTTNKDDDENEEEETTNQETQDLTTDTNEEENSQTTNNTNTLVLILILLGLLVAILIIYLTYQKKRPGTYRRRPRKR